MTELAQLSLGAAIGLIMSLAIMVILGNPLIVWLRGKSWRQGAAARWDVRADTPDSHQRKQGTPSMGGMGIALSVFLTLLSAALLLLAVMGKTWQYDISTSLSSLGPLLLTQLPLPFLFFSHAILGFADDWSKASGRGGLRALAKFGVQIALSAIFVLLVLWLAQSAGINPYNKDVYAGFSDVIRDAWWWAIPLAVLTVVALCNAVNLSDGLDGLAAGLALQSVFALALINGSWTLQYLFLAVAGACIGFLVFNRHPAKIIMGDTGSLALGAVIGGGAILLGGFWLLPFVAFIAIVEMFSVVVQVLWFKYTRRKTGTGQRLLKRAPLHHHFELAGWSEWRVVLTFWGINLLTTILGLWLWGIGVLPRWPA